MVGIVSNPLSSALIQLITDQILEFRGFHAVHHLVGGIHTPGPRVTELDPWPKGILDLIIDQVAPSPLILGHVIRLL